MRQSKSIKITEGFHIQKAVSQQLFMRWTYFAGDANLNTYFIHFCALRNHLFTMLLWFIDFAQRQTPGDNWRQQTPSCTCAYCLHTGDWKQTCRLQTIYCYCLTFYRPTTQKRAVIDQFRLAISALRNKNYMIAVMNIIWANFINISHIYYHFEFW